MMPALRLDDFDGYILDWDGVIAETKLDFSAVRARFFGGHHVALLEEMEQLEPEERVACMADIEAEELRGAAQAEIVPGAEDLLAWLTERHKAVAVLSRNRRVSLETASKRIGITLPPVTQTREAPHVKPDPRAFWDVADALGVSPDRCLAVGDYLYELIAARRASMRVVLVQRVAPWRTLADVAYPRLIDFLDALKRGDRFTPWEYHGQTGPTPDEPVVAGDLGCRDAWLTLEDAASRGAVRFRVPAAPLSPMAWRACPGLSPRFIDEPTCRAVAGWLVARWPLVRVEPWEEGQS